MGYSYMPPPPFFLKKILHLGFPIIIFLHQWAILESLLFPRWIILRSSNSLVIYYLQPFIVLFIRSVDFYVSIAKCYSMKQ